MELHDSWKMIALRMMLCGEVHKSVQHLEHLFKTYEGLRAVVLKLLIENLKTSEPYTTVWIAITP